MQTLTRKKTSNTASTKPDHTVLDPPPRVLHTGPSFRLTLNPPMAFYTAFSLIILLVACAAYINHLTVRLQPTIAVMLAGIVMAIGLMVAGKMHWVPVDFYLTHTVRHLNFHDLLINGMLSFLLFAGALNVDLQELKSCLWEVTTLSTLSTILSCVMVALGCHTMLHLLGIDISWLHALLFGALISPTDPIAVLATFKKLGAPRRLHAMIAGESLFNDGVGVVLFVTFYQLQFHADIAWSDTLVLFLQQSLGGLCYGAILGAVMSYLLRAVRDSHVAILMTLALVTAGYLLAFKLGISGPLAMVAAGLIIGRPIETLTQRKLLFQFWEITDELLNALLFFMIGIELLIIRFSTLQLSATLLAIPLVLIARAITVAIPMAYFKKRRAYPPFVNTMLVWGGLRGGLALALAMALPYGPANDIILPMTFAVVVFSIVVQGFSAPQVVRLTQAGT